jgi:hypothetical protein
MGGRFENPSLPNRNVDYLNSYWFWMAYLIAIAVFRAGCFAYFPKSWVSSETEWTLTAVVHAIVSHRGGRGMDGREGKGWERGRGKAFRTRSGRPWPPVPPRAWLRPCCNTASRLSAMTLR